MSPPLLSVEGKNQGALSFMASSTSKECIPRNDMGLKEHNYFGHSDCSSVDSSAVSCVPQENEKGLNLTATDLRLGLPGSQSPERDSNITWMSLGKHDEKQLFPLVPSKEGICSLSQNLVVSGNKRGFSDTVNGLSDLRCPMSQASYISIRTEVPSKTLKECSAVNISSTIIAPAAKQQVVGWPPIRSFRKNTLVSTSKNNDEVDGKPGPGACFVKVSMTTAPYLRKVDLRMYSNYEELSSALEKMFSCFTAGKSGTLGASGWEMLSESKLKDVLLGSEYVLAYEDKDGDWMLVGDVPWEMFITSCKRLKIMRSSDAIGLGYRPTEKSKTPN